MAQKRGKKKNNDLIRRKDAIYIASGYCHFSNVAKEIAKLPSVEPERRKVKWIPCSERLPKDSKNVLACYRFPSPLSDDKYVYRIVIGWYAWHHSIKTSEFSEWDADSYYCEEEDEYYILEGWYEYTTQGNSDYMHWFINAEVIAWMPLPEPIRMEN